MIFRKFAATLLAALLPTVAMAQPVIVSDSGDTAWVLTASAFVLLMALPGLGLFYGGLVRSRNVLSVIMHCFVITCTVSLLWMTFGYSLVFGEGPSLLGGLGNAFLGNLKDLRADTTIPESTFALFQMTFAIITPALIIGAYVERVRFAWVVAFSTLWTLLVYIPVARAVWGGGFLADIGTLDFAGGIVVHTTAGVAAILVAAMLKPRKGFNKSLLAPHSPALTMTGAGLLWMGWYGFNGGSALAASDDASTAIINSHMAACAAALIWIGLEKWRIGKATSVGIVTGAIAGLATITPAAGATFVGPIGALILGLLGGGICFFMVQLVKSKLKIDDSLDVFAVHGIGGMLGSILWPFLASEALGGPGLADGTSLLSQFSAQAIGVVAVALWTALATVIAALMVSQVFPMRVHEEAEHDGLDLTSHGERGWELE
jgi:ammonium transporter, Amt family